MLLFKYSVCILRTDFHFTPYTPFSAVTLALCRLHTPLCSFPCSLSMSHTLSRSLFHALLLSHVIPLSLMHTHTHTTHTLVRAPSVVNKQNRTGSVAKAQGPLLSAGLALEAIPWYNQLVFTIQRDLALFGLNTQDCTNTNTSEEEKD